MYSVTIVNLDTDEVFNQLIVANNPRAADIKALDLSGWVASIIDSLHFYTECICRLP